MSEKTQIHFKSEVFAALAIVDVKTPSLNNISQRTDTYGENVSYRRILRIHRGNISLIIHENPHEIVEIILKGQTK